MAKLEKQKTKILYVLKVLWEETDEGHPMSAQQIAERVSDYGVRSERKSIYSDLNELEEFGFDIIRTRKGTYLASRQFELPELKLLVDAVQSSKFITEKKSDELIAKLSTLLSRFEGKQLKRQVLVKNRVKSMNESIYYNIDTIYNAIDQNKQIGFSYHTWNVKKEMVPKGYGDYIISPWFLQWEDEKYYLLGFDEKANQMKHFRVDKMLGITILDKKREGKEAFTGIDMATYGKEVFRMFQGKKQTVTLKVKNELAGVMIDQFGKEVWIHPLDGEYFTARVEVMVSNQFFGWITGFGGKMEILGPVWVRQEYSNLLRNILKNSKQDCSIKAWCRL